MVEFLGVHKEFLEDQTPEIDLEGARMSGKTWAVIEKIRRSCLKYPGIEWLFSRYSDTETRTKLKTEFVKVCRMQGTAVEWNADASCYEFPENGEKVSRVFMYGLKSQNKAEHLAKIRGLGVACVAVDQTEEVPDDIVEEIRFAMRQPGYPHQLIFSPNPPSEDSLLSDQFEDGNPLQNRHYYRLSLYDNQKNLPEKDIINLETLYPPTHAKHRSLILGQRGPNVTGRPVYDRVFTRERHVGPVRYDDTRPVLESIHQGQQHPVWMCAQMSYFGGLHVFGGVMGKRLFLDDFLEIVEKYRSKWFAGQHPPRFKTCCDPPPEIGSSRFSNIAALKRAGYAPVYQASGAAPDVREAVIQDIAAMMHVQDGREGLRVNADDTKWIMASHNIEKQTKLLIDGCEASYVWDEHLVSVGNKRVRQPKVDEWVDGWQRCLENIHLNFIAGKKTDFEKDRQAELEKVAQGDERGYQRPSQWV